MKERTTEETMALLLKGGLKRGERRRLGIPEPDAELERLQAIEAIAQKLIDQSYKDSYGKLYVATDVISELEEILGIKVQNTRPWQR